jgi:hypothetical protein
VNHKKSRSDFVINMPVAVETEKGISMDKGICEVILRYPKEIDKIAMRAKWADKGFMAGCNKSKDPIITLRSSCSVSVKKFFTLEEIKKLEKKRIEVTKNW